eukprot:m.58405 g.58405  ORF g.58405 m.58405 type:complete len:72 (-) comp13519_c0_seq16:309-524(-)
MHWVRVLCPDRTGKLVYSACHDAITAWDAHNFTEAWTLKTAFGSVHAIAVTAQHLIAGTFMTWPPARTSKS